MPFILTTTFFNFDAGDITVLTGYVSDFLSDISPILLYIVAIAVALIIVGAIIKALR